VIRRKSNIDFLLSEESFSSLAKSFFFIFGTVHGAFAVKLSAMLHCSMVQEVATARLLPCHLLPAALRMRGWAIPPFYKKAQPILTKESAYS
jgi:hypothetical protein